MRISLRVVGTDALFTISGEVLIENQLIVQLNLGAVFRSVLLDIRVGPDAE
jgi:hypothetical protein